MKNIVARFQGGIPKPLMTSEIGSFARKTMLHRVPRIIDNVIIENEYPQPIILNLLELKKEILYGEVQPLTEDAPDAEDWNAVWSRFEGNTWLELPWYFAESFFYRRLLEAVKYFQSGPLYHNDPFSKSKRKELSESVDILSLMVKIVKSKIFDQKICLENLLHASLWGNRIDLSNFTTAKDVRNVQSIIERDNLLINDFHKIVKLVDDYRISRIAFINDNAGIELGFDFLLAHFLLKNGLTDKITFYLKPYPFFVSDATEDDFLAEVLAFSEASDPDLKLLAEELKNELANKTIILSNDRFWASPHHFFEMPSSLCEELSGFDVVMLKGDLNYRRLLGDLHWPYTTSIESVVSYFPTSILILRTLKSEIIVDLDKAKVDEMFAKDPDWLTCGKYGIMQYIEI
jgi:hypothetical protein